MKIAFQTKWFTLFHSNSLSDLNVSCYTWSMEMKDILSMLSLKEKSLAFIVGVILMMAAAGIANTMLMAMLERKREIGILAASGMRRREILSLFFSEGMCIGLIGSIAGLLAGGMLVLYFPSKQLL